MYGYVNKQKNVLFMYSLDYCQDGNNEFNNKYDTNSLAYKNVPISFVLVFYHNCISRTISKNADHVAAVTMIIFLVTNVTTIKLI